MAIGVRSLRADLARLVQRAGSGERIVITVAGRPVALLGPVETGGDPGGLAQLVARGMVVAPVRADRPAPDLVIPARAGARIDRLLAEIRG